MKIDMTHDEELSKDQSMQIIQQMISQAKTSLNDSGLGWLLWGSMIFLSSICTYIFLATDADNTFLAWNVFGVITIILLTYDIIRPRRKVVKTYVDDLLRLVDIGFIVSLFTIIVSMNVSVSPNSGFGFFLVIFAFLMLVKGGAVRSRSLMVGAVVNWLGAIAIFINQEFKYDMLIMAGAVLVGYIIPGLLLWTKYRRNKKLTKENKAY